jgi:hypothetical protein
MKQCTIKDLQPEVLLIGNQKDRVDYFPAVIGIAKDGSHLAYSWELLVECCMEIYQTDWEEAAAHVEYNIEGALIGRGPHAPVILEQLKITTRNQKYTPIQLKKK